MEPHGGRLVYRVVEDLDKAAALAAPRLELRPALGPGGIPIRNPYREVVPIASSPVGLYDVGEEELAALGVREGDGCC